MRYQDPSHKRRELFYTQEGCTLLQTCDVKGAGAKKITICVAYVCCVAPVRNEGTGMAPYSTPCPLEGHPKWHFIMFCRPYGHPRGHFHSVFLGALSALPLCLRLGLTGPLIVSSHDCQIHLLRTAKCSADSIFTK